MDEKIKKLRGIGTTLNAKFNIGKNGITDNVVSNIKNELKKESLVKIRILKNYIEDKDKKAIAQELVDKTNSRLVQFIGFTVVLTRK